METARSRFGFFFRMIIYFSSLAFSGSDCRIYFHKKPSTNVTWPFTNKSNRWRRKFSHDHTSSNLFFFLTILCWCMFICTFSAASSPFESYLTRMQYSLMELQQTNSVGNYFTKARTITLSLMYLHFGEKSFNDAILILKYIYKLWYQLTNKNSQIAMVHFKPFSHVSKSIYKGPTQCLRHKSSLCCFTNLGGTTRTLTED